MPLTHPRTLKIAAAGAATAALMSLGLGAASAHIEVTPEATAEGGSTQLTFRVPSESKTAKTTKIKVDLPVSTPFSSVRAKPVAGWTAQIVKGKLPKPVTVNGATVTEAPLSVTWTATDPQHQLSDQQYQTFSIFAGRLPKSGTTVMLPIVQTYSDGSVRNWDDPAVEGQDEPQDPAPSFVTTAAAAEGAHAEPAAAAAAAEQATQPAAAVTADNTTQGLTWAALAAGILGLATGAAALFQARRTRS
ncbi:YcnI family copper-binding membrane protein [Arthrobacter sp. QXT-31]|uniref:YcnI family copper-binding membrane protein n=1 Tax=Arthrobacter sp. QXT-31 TaxID=1357915 RepID=UPI000971A673|nr:YcnI family protein [Arthrobacter sp. QXT-31]APX00447.1 nuclear export factor GLE1 [Arthrobacter sp. QXT-31]